MAPPQDTSQARVLIAGGGIAGVEAMLALSDLASDRCSVTMVSPDPELHYKPLIVEEPFSHQPAERRALAPAIERLGGRFLLGAVKSVRTDVHAVAVSRGSTVEELEYDLLLACVGGRHRAAYKRAVTFRFRSISDPLEVDKLLVQAEAHDSRLLAFVVPPGITWPLPLYELALLTRRRAEESGRSDLRITLLTPEEEPLIVFGRAASETVGQLLEARGIEFHGGAIVREEDDGTLRLTPGDEHIDAGAVAALPVLGGPHLGGLPCDEGGFLPIDDHARVQGADDVYAAGDGTNFPIKQGGIGTQQADAAAEHIAARLGADVDPQPFHPVLRGKLITGVESMNLRQDLTGGHGEGTASSDYLWWPPHKVSGRYLAPWLAGEDTPAEPEPPGHSIDVEVALPKEWHSEPMAINPFSPPGDE